MDKVAVVGIGRLGLCLALNLEKAGYKVAGIDTNVKYIDSLRENTFDSPEPHVNTMLEHSGIDFSTHIPDALGADLIFVCVATPSLPSGAYDHSQIEAVMEALAASEPQAERKEVAINCTTLPGYCADLQSRYEPFKVSYNPEFIRQGCIIEDQIRPDLVLVGQCDAESGEKIAEAYSRMCANEPKYAYVTPTSGEIIKLSLNCFLTAKIAMANTVGDLAVKLGEDPQPILDAIGEDTRIGSKFMGYGFGFGGPCFPRDNRAFQYSARSAGTHSILNNAVDGSNTMHREHMVKRFIDKYDAAKDEVVIDNVSYKEGTDIITESQQLAYAVALARHGFDVVLDVVPRVREQVEGRFPGLFRYKGSI